MSWIQDPCFFAGGGICRVRKGGRGPGRAPIDAADAAFRIQALPGCRSTTLWEGDEEFEPRMSILFDRSVERHLPARCDLGAGNSLSLRR